MFTRKHAIIAAVLLAGSTSLATSQNAWAHISWAAGGQIHDDYKRVKCAHIPNFDKNGKVVSYTTICPNGVSPN
jgi:hypothetical protein